MSTQNDLIDHFDLSSIWKELYACRSYSFVVMDCKTIHQNLINIYNPVRWNTMKSLNEHENSIPVPDWKETHYVLTKR